MIKTAHYIKELIRTGEGYHLRIEKAVLEHGKGTVSFTFNGFFSVSFSRVQAVRGFPVKDLGERLGERLGENRLKIISLMKENSKISISELADKIGISTTSIEKNIGYLKKQDIVRRIGPARGGYWEVVEDDE